MNIVDLPKLYTDSEAAIRLRCSPQTIGRLRRSGKLGFTRVAKKVYITDSHIRAYLDKNECAATSISGTGRPIGISTSTTSAPDRSAELALARQIAGKQRISEQTGLVGVTTYEVCADCGHRFV